jgi:hypothetical protein
MIGHYIGLHHLLRDKMTEGYWPFETGAHLNDI